MTDEKNNQGAARAFDEEEKVTLRLERSCEHFSFTIEFSGDTNELNSGTSERATIERLAAAAELMVYGKPPEPFARSPFTQSPVDSMILESPTEESIDAALAQLRAKMMEHLHEHEQEGDTPQ